jgi:hypothetical protein
MKTLLKIFVLITVISLSAGCNKTDVFIEDSIELKRAQVDVTLPFEAKLTGVYTGVFYPGDDDYNCEAPFFCRVNVDANGTAKLMGKITAQFDFCACGPSPEDGSMGWGYGPTVTTFVAANGDLLHAVIEGYVRPGRLPHHPEDVASYWHDPFTIIGGTGRFEGATGSGWTDDYNRDSYPANSFHHWRGTISLKKGKL